MNKSVPLIKELFEENPRKFTESIDVSLTISSKSKKAKLPKKITLDLSGLPEISRYLKNQKPVLVIGSDEDAEKTEAVAFIEFIKFKNMTKAEQLKLVEKNRLLIKSDLTIELIKLLNKVTKKYLLKTFDDQNFSFKLKEFQSKIDFKLGNTCLNLKVGVVGESLDLIEPRVEKLKEVLKVSLLALDKSYFLKKVCIKKTMSRSLKL